VSGQNRGTTDALVKLFEGLKPSEENVYGRIQGQAKATRSSDLPSAPRMKPAGSIIPRTPREAIVDSSRTPQAQSEMDG